MRSILGRFLEHSRILHVRNGGQDEVYIGSADLMHRNLDRRVETLIRVDDEIARGRLLGLLDLSGRANVGVWTLGADGGWTQIVPAPEEVRVDIQRELMQRALGRA